MCPRGAVIGDQGDLAGDSIQHGRHGRIDAHFTDAVSDPVGEVEDDALVADRLREGDQFAAISFRSECLYGVTPGLVAKVLSVPRLAAQFFEGSAQFFAARDLSYRPIRSFRVRSVIPDDRRLGGE